MPRFLHGMTHGPMALLNSARPSEHEYLAPTLASLRAQEAWRFEIR